MKSNLLSRAEAWKRLLQAKPEDWVLRHCRAVEEMAVALGDRAIQQGLTPNMDLISRGALLHDIGRSITHDIRHASLGADMLRNDPQPDELVLIVERHTGAGLDAIEAAAAKLPARRYVPETLEERIVAHADNLFSGDTRLSLAQIEAKYEAKELPAAWQKILALHNQLSSELDCDIEQLPAAIMPPF